MRVLTCINMKGGVGKSTTVDCLCSALSGHIEKRLRVLAVDLDPQCNYSVCVGTPYPNLLPEKLDLDPKKLVAAFRDINAADNDDLAPSIGLLLLDQILNRSTVPIESTIRPIRMDYDYIPAEPDMVFYDQAFEQVPIEDPNGEYPYPRVSMLAQVIQKINQLGAEGNRSSPYDVCVIDTNPSLGYLTQNALMASTDIIIPVSAEFLPLLGIIQVAQRIANAVESGAPIQNVFVLVTMVSSNNVCKESIATLKEIFGKSVIPYHIPRAVAVQHSQVAGKSIVDRSPSHPVSEAYIKTAQLLVRKMKL